MEYLKKYVLKHNESIKLFGILFLLNILIFGQKIFFNSYTSDDYNRFYLNSDTSSLISESGRWAQVLLNKYIFFGKLQIMPYLHGLIGIASFSLMGFLTASYFEIKSKVEIVLVTLLISSTPMVAHNIIFSTNITAWITMTLAYSSFLFLLHKQWWYKILAFVLFVFAIANYQTIIQIAFIVLIFNIIKESLAITTFKEFKNTFTKLILYALFIILALFVSNKINHYFLEVYHLSVSDRFQHAGNIFNVDYLFNLVHKMYTALIRFDYFDVQLHVLYSILSVSSIISIYIYLLRRNILLSLRIMTIVLISTLLLLVPFILNAPLVVENWIAVRSHLAVGFALAGFYMLLIPLKGIIKNIIYFIVVWIIIISIYYINVFLDANIRQTKSDINRANMIVERIRMHENYVYEPLKLRIIGTRKFNVLGMKQNFNQAFFLNKPKYNILKSFTDFSFSVMTDKEYKSVVAYLINRGTHIYAYPGKNSIIVYEGKAVVFFDSYDINALIDGYKYLNNFPKRTPDVKSFFNLYLQDNTLFYEKEACSENDIKEEFFLRLNLKDNSEINMDFYFLTRGKKENNKCIVAVSLPLLDNYKIRTGQFIRGKKIIWEADLNHDD